MAKEVMEGQGCPVCRKKTLTLSEEDQDIPFFGKTFIFSMSCSNCHFYKADVEAAEMKDPTKYTFETSGKDDMDVRVIKSSEATVKIPTLRMSMEPGPASEGFITNVEGLLTRFKKVVEEERDSTEDNDVKKKAKNLLKKMWKIEVGDIPMKIVIEDPTGNSAIITDKAKVEKLKKKK